MDQREVRSTMKICWGDEHGKNCEPNTGTASMRPTGMTLQPILLPSMVIDCNMRQTPGNFLPLTLILILKTFRITESRASASRRRRHHISWVHDAHD